MKILSSTSNSSLPLKRASFLCLILILILGSFLRVVDLGGRDFWGDEVESYHWAKLGFLDMTQTMITDSPHLPFYFYLLRLWLFLGKTDSFARLLSSIFGILTLIVTYKFVLELFNNNRTVALVSTLLLAISPLHLMFSRMVREYALLGLLATSSYYLFLKWQRVAVPLRRRYLTLYFIVSLLMAYTHYYGWFVIVSQGVYLLLSKERKVFLGSWAIVQGLVLLLFLPWFFKNVYYLMHGAGYLKTYYGSGFGPVVKAAYFLFEFSLGETVYAFRYIIVLPAAAVFGYLFIAGLQWGYKKYPEGMKLAFIYFSLPFLLGLFISACAPRQLLAILLPFYAILALGILRHRLFFRVIFLSLLILFSSISLGNYFTNREYMDVDMITPWRQIIKVITDGSREGDAIVLGSFPEGFNHYYSGKLKVYILKGDNPEEELSRIFSRHSRAWVLLTVRPWRQEAKDWLEKNTKVRMVKNYLLEEHTLEGLKKGLANIHEFKSFTYTLYLCERRKR